MPRDDDTFPMCYKMQYLPGNFRQRGTGTPPKGHSCCDAVVWIPIFLTDATMGMVVQSHDGGSNNPVHPQNLFRIWAGWGAALTQEKEYLPARYSEFVDIISEACKAVMGMKHLDVERVPPGSETLNVTQEMKTVLRKIAEEEGG